MVGKYDEKITWILNDFEYWTKEIEKAMTEKDTKSIQNIKKIIRSILEQLHYYVTINNENIDVEKVDKEILYWRRKFEDEVNQGNIKAVVDAFENIKKIEKQVKEEPYTEL